MLLLKSERVGLSSDLRKAVDVLKWNLFLQKMSKSSSSPEMFIIKAEGIFRVGVGHFVALDF